MDAFEPFVDLPIIDPLPDTVPLEQLLATQPFIPVPGSFNLRRLPLPSTARVGGIFRCGDLSRLGPEGADVLRREGIQNVYDLRNAEEHSLRPPPSVLTDRESGITVVLCARTTERPTAVAEEHSAASLVARKDQLVGPGGDLLLKMYSLLLKSHAESYGIILRQLLHDPNTPLLFHCTAGKDRTGLGAAVILSLAGLSKGEVALEYSLTRLGIEPARNYLTEALRGTFKLSSTGEDTVAHTPEEAAEARRAEELNLKGIFEQLGGSRRETMLAVLELIESEWGGLDAYLVKAAGLTTDEIGELKALLSGTA